MKQSTPERPRQVTMAGWMIMVGSVVALALVVQRLSGLHTLETQDSVESFLSKPPGSDLGIGVDTVTTMLRTLAMVTAGCATAAAILGFHVLRGSRSARIGLTVLAVPLFLAGMVTGGFITSVVAASAVILWLQPARSWFDGVPPPERRTPERRTPPAPTPTSPPAPAASPGPSTALPPTQPFAPGSVTGSVSAAHPGSSATPGPATRTRPPGVFAACLLTWVCSGLVTIGLAATAVVLALNPDRIIDEARETNPEFTAQGISDDLLLATTFVMLAGLVLWCVGAAVVALLVFRGIEWARIVLVVSAAVCGVLCLVGVAVGAYLLVAPLLASSATVAMLLRSDSRPWFQRRDTP